MRTQAAALLVGLVAGVAHAESRLTLAQAQAEARAHAPDVRELAARLRGAEAIARAARRVLTSNPVVSGSIAPGAVVGRPEELTWDVGVQQQLDLSGSWKTRGASAAADADKVRLDREDGFRALDEAVAVAVADLAFAEARIARTTRIAQLFRVSAEAANRQLAVGQGNQIDTDVAELDLASAQADAAEAAGSLRVAQAVLGRLLGRARCAELTVADAPPPTEPSAEPDLAALIERDPRVRAAEAELRAAHLQLETWARMIVPTLTLGVSYGYQRRDIPEGSFAGPGASGLSAVWPDAEVAFTVGLPLPLFDLKQPERAQATARIVSAEARLAVLRADLREQLETAWVSWMAMTQSYGRLARTPEIIDREFDLLDKALRAGALDAVSRALALRRLQDAALRVDNARHDLRVAFARWMRASAQVR